MHTNLVSRLVCAGPSVSDSGDSRVMSVKKGMLLSLPSHVCGHIVQYNLFERLCDSFYDMNLGCLAYDRFQEVDGVSLGRHGTRTTLIQGR